MNELLDLALSEGWRNVTNFYLVEKEPLSSVCKSSLSGTCQSFTPGQILKKMFSKTTCEWVAQQLNEHYYVEMPGAKSQNSGFSADQVLQIGLTTLLFTVDGGTDWQSFRGKADRNGVSEKVMKRFNKYLNLHWKQFFVMVNKDIKACIVPGGLAAGDETMVPWMGDDGAIEKIERKPNDIGFKFLTLCLQLTRTKR
jgi:hypothetical protein